MDELRQGGRLNADDWSLICEMNAIFMSKPERAIEPAIEAIEARRAADRERKRRVRGMSAECPQTKKERTKERNNKNKNIIPPNPPDASFEVFYQAYPKRRARGKAQQAYTKAISLGATAEELLAGAKRYAVEVRGKESQFVAFPASWLNQQRWLDEPERTPQTNVVGFRKEFAPETEGPKVSEEERQANLAKLATIKFGAKKP